jgi:peptidoglycan/LPS O-acetylase OafA/YrhL
MAAIGYSIIALFYTCLILISVTEGHGLITRITSISYLRNLGTIGYGVYIVHQALLLSLHGLILHAAPSIASTRGILVTVLALALTLAITTLSWKFYEKPLLSVGHRFKYSFENRPSEIAALPARD